MSKGYVDWSKMEQRNNSSNDDRQQVEYLKFAPGKHRVRLLKQAYFYDQHFISKEKTGAERDIPVISPGRDNDPLIPLGNDPSEKCAVNIIDRKDGKLKVMRVGPSVYNHFISYAQDAEVNPGDPKEGPDFVITVEDPGGNARQRKYGVTALKAAPLTKAEVAMIKEAGGLPDLEVIFKPTSVEKIEEMIEKYDMRSDGGASFESEKADSGESFKSQGDDEDSDDDEFGF